VSRPIVYPLDGVKVWQVEDSLPANIEKALDFRPETDHRYQSAGIAVALVSLVFALAFVAYALFTEHQLLLGLAIIAVAIGLIGAWIGINIHETPKKRLQTRADIKRNAEMPRLISEHSPFFKAIMAPELVSWLEEDGVADSRLKEDVRYALECYLTEAVADTVEVRSRLLRADLFTPPADMLQISYEMMKIITDAAERFEGELASLTGVRFGDHFVARRQELEDVRRKGLRAFLAQSNREKERVKKLLGEH
jgi:hypothetical protein